MYIFVRLTLFHSIQSDARTFDAVAADVLSQKLDSKNIPDESWEKIRKLNSTDFPRECRNV